MKGLLVTAGGFEPPTLCLIGNQSSPNRLFSNRFGDVFPGLLSYSAVLGHFLVTLSKPFNPNWRRVYGGTVHHVCKNVREQEHFYLHSVSYQYGGATAERLN